MKRTIIKICNLILIVTVMLSYGSTAFAYTNKSVISEEHTQGHRVVRVGWFYSEGVHNIDENGMPSGFDYDYLQGISQYTDWDYEYVIGSWSECYEWLKEGKIDLLGIVNKTPDREKIFDYSYTSVGTELCCLMVDTSNTKYAYEDFSKFDGMTIGIEEGTYQVNILKDYAKQNDFKYKTVVYPTLSDGQKAVSRGEIDALLASNTDVIKGLKTIAQFNPIPFYFATTKGNSELLKELNHGINQLFVYYPNFNNYLYSKYYNTNVSSKIVFTEEELEYINSKPEVNILFDPIWYPIEYSDEKNGNIKGIIPDLLKVISKKSNLTFNYIDVGNSVKALSKIKKASNNVITSISYDYKWANKNNVKITQPIIDASIMYVTNQKNTSPKTVGLVKLDYITETVKQLMPNLTPVYYDSMAACVAAVKEGRVDCAYLNNFEAEYYMSMSEYDNLKFHTTDLFRQKICLGISETADPRLLSIISKCLQNISDNEIQSIIYQNSLHTASVTLSGFARDNPLTILFLGFCFCLILALFYYYSMKNKIKNSKLIAIENQRYSQLAEITNEHIYEYNYHTDTLTFNNAPEGFLHGLSIINNYTSYVNSSDHEDSDSCQILYDCFKERKDIIKEVSLSLNNNEPCWYKLITKIISDEDGKPIYAIGKIKNIQSEHEEKEQLIEQAKCDSLTGIYNSKTFRNLSEKYLEKGSTLLILDIDHFKQVNDQYGHLSGDLAIVSIAKIISEVFKEVGITGRIGGDEFGIFTPKTISKDKLDYLCTELLNKASNITLNFNGETIKPISVSVGGYSSKTNENYSSIYKNADKVLYEVKENGRNNFLVK